MFLFRSGHQRGSTATSLTRLDATFTRRRLWRGTAWIAGANAAMTAAECFAQDQSPSSHKEVPDTGESTSATTEGAGMNERDGMHWVGTWTTTPDPVEGVALADQTLRMITRISIGGSRLRVRLSNAYGARTLTVGAAHLGFEASGRT